MQPRIVAEDSTFHFKFTTRQFSAGGPFTLAGTPSLAVYIDDGTTQVTAGITLVVDFDSKTGLNHVTIDLSASASYVAGAQCQVVIEAGTVDSVSVVGEVLYEFEISADGDLTDAIADVNAILVDTGTTLQAEVDDIQSRLPAALTAGGNMKADALALSGDTTAADNAEAFFDGTGYSTPIFTALKGAGLLAHRATIQTVTNQTNFIIPATDDAPNNDAYLEATAVFIDGTDPNQISIRRVTDYVASTRTVTIDAAPDFTITNADTLCIIPTSVGALRNSAFQTSTRAVLNNGHIGADVMAWNGSTDLSGAIADIVWGLNILASLYNSGDTFGKLAHDILADTAEIGTAGAGLTEAGGTGDHLTALAQASVCTEARLAELDAANLPTDVAARATPAQVNAEVLDVLNVDTLIDSKTIVAALKIIGATTAGKVSGAGTGTEVFVGLDGVTTRVTSTVDDDGNRSSVVYA